MTASALASPASIPDPKQLSTLLRRSRLLLAFLVVGLAIPMAAVPISSAVIAPGELTVASRVKKIAHPRGGVIAEILVGNGSHVRAGQLLMRLDTRVSAASAAMTINSIDQLLAREARLRAERDGLAAISWPAGLLQRRTVPEVAQAMAEEQRVFELDRQAVAGQRATIQAQIAQTAAAIGSYRTQADVYRQQADLIAEERRANEELWVKRFTTLQRRNELARAAVGMNGNVASSMAQAAQLGSKAAELRQQIVLIEQEARRQAGAELAQVQTRLVELQQNSIVADDANNRNLIRALYDGVVDKLAFTTVGGVVPAGETIMEVVPDNDPLIVVARVGVGDVDDLYVGQPVTLRFSAFNSGTTPEITGSVSKISADRTVDAQRGAAYYPVEISIPETAKAKLGAVKLRSGMPVEAFIQRGTRTMLSFVGKPLADQFKRAFR